MHGADPDDAIGFKDPKNHQLTTAPPLPPGRGQGDVLALREPQKTQHCEGRWLEGVVDFGAICENRAIGRWLNALRGDAAAEHRWQGQRQRQKKEWNGKKRQQQGGLGLSKKTKEGQKFWAICWLLLLRLVPLDQLAKLIHKHGNALVEKGPRRVFERAYRR